MAKKSAVTSPQEKSRIAQGIGKVIRPPDHIPMTKLDTTFFDNIIQEFAKADWTMHQVELAALMAKAMADMVEQQELLREEGMTARSERGSPCVNPRKSVVQMLAGTILSMRKSLALQSSRAGQASEPARVAPQKKGAKALEANMIPKEDDNLLATPN